jgi:hypothetical protein
MGKLAKLFIVKSRWEAWAVIYSIAAGAATRGISMLQHYPGWLGLFMSVACLGVVFLAGGAILDYVSKRNEAREEQQA